MSTYDPPSSEEAPIEDDLLDLDFMWNMPIDVLLEWSTLPEEELESRLSILKELLSDVSDTIALATINTRIFPAAAHELKKSLEAFRLSLKDLSFPKEIRETRH